MNTSQADIIGKVVLVTGGTRGIGLVIATSYALQGAQVVVCGRNLSDEQAVILKEKKLDFYAVDVRDADALVAMFDFIDKKYGKLDIVINNAGGSPYALAADASPRFHEGIIKLNLLAPLHVAQQANRLMQRNTHGGVIIFIGSISALRPSPGTAAYGAAKAGILKLVESLAVEWAPKVRVVTVSPGLVKTEQSHLHYGDEKGIAAVSGTIPLGRMATPEDVADACIFASSAGASYISGSNILLHGGGEKPAFLGVTNN